MLKKLNSWLWLSVVVGFFNVANAFADGVAGAPGQPGPSMAGMLMPFLLMFGVIYLMILRPQQKRMREQGNLLKELKHGDEVLTSSGILGTITGITEKVVTLEVASNVRVKMLKSQVSHVIKGGLKDLAVS